MVKREKQRALWPSEAAVSDVVGRLIEFWGFKRNMGRVWTVLYLSPEPLSADDLCHSLKLSTGAVSMTLSELARWGVVRRVWIQGQRRDFYAAFRASRRTSTEQEEQARAELQRARISRLLDLARLGQRLIDALLSTAKVDAEPLVRFLLGQR